MVRPGISAIIGYCIAVIYVILGLTVLWQPGDLLQIPAGYSTPLALVLIAYGIIRGYRSYQKSI
jgi:hypothetical protein